MSALTVREAGKVSRATLLVHRLIALTGVAWCSGPRHRIPRLWAFIALAEILPASYTQNLFYIALIRSTGGGRVVTRDTRMLQVYVMIVYAFTVIMAGVARLAWLVPLILFARLLLLVPILAVTFGGTRPVNDETVVKRDCSSIGSVVRLAAIALVGLMLQNGGWTRFGPALFSHPAVSALGCDAVLSLLSLIAWHLLT